MTPHYALPGLKTNMTTSGKRQQTLWRMGPIPVSYPSARSLSGILVGEAADNGFEYDLNIEP